MFKLFRRDHTSAIDKDVRAHLAHERAMNATDRRMFWQFHARATLETLPPVYAQVLDDPGFRQHVASLG